MDCDDPDTWIIVRSTVGGYCLHVPAWYASDSKGNEGCFVFRKGFLPDLSFEKMYYARTAVQMKSIAIVRATDILKIRSTLLEINRAGIEFDGGPKEINPASVEKVLSRPSEKNYEFCSLVPIMQDYDFSRGIIKALTLYSEVLLIDESSELFSRFSRLIQVLPDLDLPNQPYKEIKKQITPPEKTTSVYLGVFVDKKVQLHTISGMVNDGILRNADPIGVFFEPLDGSSSVFFTWHDIKKIVIPREEKS